MRQITRLAADAFINGRNFSRQNMTVSHNVGNVALMYLHGNLIAERASDGVLRMTLAGWNTPTTRERLNGLLEVMNIDGCFYQKNFEPYFDGREISSDEWVVVA